MTESVLFELSNPIFYPYRYALLGSAQCAPNEGDWGPWRDYPVDSFLPPSLVSQFQVSYQTLETQISGYGLRVLQIGRFEQNYGGTLPPEERALIPELEWEVSARSLYLLTNLNRLSLGVPRSYDWPVGQLTTFNQAGRGGTSPFIEQINDKILDGATDSELMSIHRRIQSEKPLNSGIYRLRRQDKMVICPLLVQKSKEALGF